jgi:hypothetical protein
MRRLMHTGTARQYPALAQRYFLLGLVVIFVSLSIQYSIKATANRSAFVRWRDQILQLSQEDIYQRYAYPNPPIMALLLDPIAELPPLQGSLVWFYLKLAMTAAALYWAWRIVETPDRPFPPWAKAAVIVLSLRPIMGDLSHGNVNLFILFLIAGALYAFCQRRDYVAGAVLALAIACKVTPALFIPYFLWKRAWRTLAGCLAGLLAFFVIVPAVVLGSGRNLDLLNSWVHQMVTPYVVQGTVTTEHQNQSLPGVLFRLATHNPSFIDDKGIPQRYDNFIDIDPAPLKWFVKGCMVAFAGLAVWCCRTPVSSRRGWRLAAEFSLVALGMLLFSERTWKHHCVTFVLPFAVICYYLWVVPASRILRGYLVGSLAVVFLLMASTSTTLVEFFDAKLAQVYGAYVWAYLVLIASLVVLLRRDEPAGLQNSTIDSLQIAPFRDMNQKGMVGSGAGNL